jgi:hypothetical protein
MACPRRGAKRIASIAPRDGASVIPECRWYKARRGQKGSAHASDVKGYREQERRFVEPAEIVDARFVAGWSRRGRKPLTRATPHDPRRIAAWRAQDYPRIAARAKREKAAIHWTDETGVRDQDRIGPSARAQEVTRLTLRRDLFKSPLPVVICENDRGRSWYVCGQARYGREPQLRAPSPLCARRVRDDEPPDGDDARRRSGERRQRGDAHPPDALVTAPFTLLLPESAQS